MTPKEKLRLAAVEAWCWQRDAEMPDDLEEIQRTLAGTKVEPDFVAEQTGVMKISGYPDGVRLEILGSDEVLGAHELRTLITTLTQIADRLEK